MTTKYATMNIEMRDQFKNPKSVKKLQDFLTDALHEADAEEGVFFFSGDGNVLSLGIPFADSDQLALLEAGEIIGNCMAQYQEAKLGLGFRFWKSINNVDGAELDSPYMRD